MADISRTRVSAGVVSAPEERVRPRDVQAKHPRKSRVLTEKRKIQNRLAQRRYREKQAKYLLELKSFAAQNQNQSSPLRDSVPEETLQSCDEVDLPSTLHFDIPGQICTFQNGHGASPSLEHSFAESGQITNANLAGFTNDEIELTQSAIFEPAPDRLATDTFNTIEPSILVSNHNHLRPGYSLTYRTAPGRALEETSQPQFQWPTGQMETGGLPSKFKFNPSNWPQPVSSTTQFLNFGTFPKTAAAFSIPDDLEPYETLQGLPEKHLNVTSSFRALFQLPDSTENNHLIQMAAVHKYTIGDIISAGLKALDQEAASTSDPQQPSFSLPAVADPYKNNLKLVHYSTIQAYICNAQALGYSIPDILVAGCLSPFHCPEVTESDDLQSLTLALSNGITTHLQPTKPQILYSHSPHLDLIPFPTMRARAVTYTSCTPPLIDAMEFKKDCVQNNGLTCWAVGDKLSQQPWDMRSWEAAPWFLRKYWMLVGGEEGEVWAQTKWWRRLKGEST